MNNLIYIAGPYGRSKGVALETLVKNVLWANKFASEMFFKGWIPIIPHNWHYMMMTMNEWPDEKLFKVMGLEVLKICNAILMTIGWERSEGSRQELAEAERLGLEVFYSIEDVPNVKDSQ